MIIKSHYKFTKVTHAIFQARPYKTKPLKNKVAYQKGQKGAGIAIIRQGGTYRLDNTNKWHNYNVSYQNGIKLCTKVVVFSTAAGTKFSTLTKKKLHQKFKIRIRSVEHILRPSCETWQEFSIDLYYLVRCCFNSDLETKYM